MKKILLLITISTILFTLSYSQECTEWTDYNGHSISGNGTGADKLYWSSGSSTEFINSCKEHCENGEADGVNGVCGAFVVVYFDPETHVEPNYCTFKLENSTPYENSEKDAFVISGISTLDCTGYCGGSAIVDVCGECGGNNDSCSGECNYEVTLGQAFICDGWPTCNNNLNWTIEDNIPTEFHSLIDRIDISDHNRTNLYFAKEPCPWTACSETNDPETCENDGLDIFCEDEWDGTLLTSQDEQEMLCELFCCLDEECGDFHRDNYDSGGRCFFDHRDDFIGGNVSSHASYNTHVKPLDCMGVPNGDSVEDCLGECNGTGLIDECGECGGDNSSCSGCTDEFALNYDENAIVSDDGLCSYPSSESVVWKFDISAEMTTMTGDYLIDQHNRIGFYYSSQEEATANGQVTPLPDASDQFDPFWDVAEPVIANPANEIHFYIENNWDEMTGWGHEWAYDIRAFNDTAYASNNTTTFNGIVIADLGGQGVLTISPGGATNLLDDSGTYVPVYAQVTGGGHNGEYFKIEGETKIPLNLETGVAMNVDFIVGNLVPESADGLALSTSSSDDANGNDWKPSNGVTFSTDSSCDGISINGIDFADANGSIDYSLIECNAYEQRYPAHSYTVSTDSDGAESGMNSASHSNVSKDSELYDGEDNLEFASEYTYTVTAHNGAGTGGSTSTSITTVGNINPEFTDLCDNDGGYNNDCSSVIESSATAHDGTILFEADDTGLLTDPSDDQHLYHTYTPLHDGCGQLNGCGDNGDEPGLDADGIDQSGTEITVSLLSSYTDHEGYLLDASWSGDAELSNVSINSVGQCEGAEVINSLPYTANGTYDSEGGPWQTFNTGDNSLWEYGQSGYALEYTIEQSTTIDISSCGTEGDPIMTIYQMTGDCEMENIYDNDDEEYDLDGNSCPLNGCATGAFGLQLNPGTYYIVISSLWNDIDYGDPYNATDPFGGCCPCIEDADGNCLEDENGWGYSQCGGDSNGNANVVLNITETSNSMPRSSNQINAREVSLKLDRPINQSNTSGLFYVDETSELRNEGAGEFLNGNSSSVQFTTTEPNSGEGSSFTFDLTITDNEWLTNNSNGLNTNNTSITVTVLPEPNQEPIANISVPAGQLDQDGGAYWQVPHNGDNEYTCDDLVAYEGQDCDDNKAEVTLSYNTSTDPDCSDNDGHCEENDHWWSEALMGLTFNDMNANGYFDDGEPCSDATECLWTFNADGISPSAMSGDLSHADSHSQRHSGGSGYIWALTVQDNYGAENTTARGFYILPEQNTRAYAVAVSDASSAKETDSGASGNSDDDFHYIPEGASSTVVTINEGSISDAEGDRMTYSTTLNGDLINEGSCDDACTTPGFSADLGVGDYTVETCVLDSYEGYEYLLDAHLTGVDQSIEVTQNDANCQSFTFTVLPEPAPVHVSSLEATDQGMSYITMSWNPSDFTTYPDNADHSSYAQLEEYGENAVHYNVERTLTADDVDSWEGITVLNILRDYSASDCDGKFEDYENYADGCQNPNDAQASDDGEWYFTGRGDDGKFHFLDEGLEPNTTYNYRIFATNSHGRVSVIGNVLTHSTEAKPQLTFDRDMSAEIYAVDNSTNPLTAIFTAEDGLDGHNVSSASSSYSTYEGSTGHESLYAGTSGAETAGPASIDLSYTVTAWETDHGQSIEVCFEDAGDYWGYDKEGSCLTTATFTGTEEFLHKDYIYNGWHMFGSPLYKSSSMTNLFNEGLGELSPGSDYVWFTESGNFGEAIQYNFGQAYILGLNSYLTSFTMQGNILTSAIDEDANNNLSLANHSLDRGWNLLSPKLIRSIDVGMLSITDEAGEHTWEDAHELGIISGEVLKMGQYGYGEVSSFAPWTGYWIHASKACDLIVEPHGYNLSKGENDNDHFSWNLNLQAVPVDGDGFGDIIKLGLSDNASNYIVDGEDTPDIPILTMADKYIDLFFTDENNVHYWKNTKSMITPDQGQLWNINGYSVNTTSDIKLSWSMDELDESYPVTLFINGHGIDMRSETEIFITANELQSMSILVGDDPLASDLSLPTDFGLSEAYPNPFNPVTGMKLSLIDDGHTSVKVFNLMGQEIETIHDGFMNAGYHQINWNAINVPSGIYLVKVVQGKNITSQKVMLMK